MINFAHVSTLFFGINDKILKLKSLVQQKKYYKVVHENKRERTNLNTLFLNSVAMSCLMLKLLTKVLNFCLVPKQLNCADYLAHFELFYRNIHNLEVLSNEFLDFVETKTKETTLSSFIQCSKNPQQILSKEELAALANLSKNKDIVIAKSDKGNCVVIVNKETCLREWKIF